MLKRLLFLIFCVSILSGCVETVVVGTVAAGAVMLSDGGVFDLSQDSRIETSIKKSFKKDGDKDEYKHININVYNAKVMLTGYVNDSIYKTKATQKARGTKPGIEVVDEIMIFAPNYKSGSVNDSFISSQISLKMKATNGIVSGNYEYNVVDGIVFIIGRAENRKELQKVTDLISRIKGVKKVVSYIIVATSSN